LLTPYQSWLICEKKKQTEALSVCGLHCTAHAKLMMRAEVTVQDAVCAVSLMESSMQVLYTSFSACVCMVKPLLVGWWFVRVIWQAELKQASK